MSTEITRDYIDDVIDIQDEIGWKDAADGAEDAVTALVRNGRLLPPAWRMSYTGNPCGGLFGLVRRLPGGTWTPAGCLCHTDGGEL